jgi:farnesyl-diphosphate farnesyltransferase
METENSLWVLKEQQAYLIHYMKRVSRSFSLVAPEVDSPLDDYLATAYLICRVVDNIEDTQETFKWQQARYAEFAEVLDHPQSAERILSRWDQLAWPGLIDSEQEMMTTQNGHALWQIYAQMPDPYRQSVYRWVSVMAKGMERSGNPDTSDYFFWYGDFRLPRLESDYDLYCFYVAGTVGRLITELAIHFYGLGEGAARLLLESSDSCGRALQKTNIIKDFANDLQRGVCYLPGEWMQDIYFAPLALSNVPPAWKRMVLLNVLQELESSVSYVLALPQNAIGYRKASLLMMLPALETILLAARRLPDLFTPRHAVKISRVTMGQCVLRARGMADDNWAIRTYVDEMSLKIRSQLDLVTSGVK